MTEDLIARLKAAHEAATPGGPWEADRNDHGDGYVVRYEEKPYFHYMLGTQPYYDADINPVADAELIVLVRNNLPQIIAALEERERMRAVVDVAQRRLTDLPSRYIEHGVEVYAHFCMDLRAALDALEE